MSVIGLKLCFLEKERVEIRFSHSLPKTVSPCFGFHSHSISVSIFPNISWWSLICMSDPLGHIKLCHLSLVNLSNFNISSSLCPQDPVNMCYLTHSVKGQGYGIFCCPHIKCSKPCGLTLGLICFFETFRRNRRAR